MYGWMDGCMEFRQRKLWLYDTGNASMRCVVYYICCNLPPTTEELYVSVRTPEFVCLSVCLSVCLCVSLGLLKNVCMDLDEMLRVDGCRDMKELINF